MSWWLFYLKLPVYFIAEFMALARAIRGELDQAYGMNFAPGLSGVNARGWETTREQRDWETKHEHCCAIADIYA
ncbi:MAG: hypothetical protein ACOYKC_01600 [Anaerolineaceae bacterium]|jgi:hypothetical protein